MEKRLIAAVLGRAVQDLRGDLRDIPIKDRPKVIRDAGRWISSNRETPFSFRWCSDELGLDFRLVRKKIRERPRE